LQARFPKANITLLTCGWGSHRSIDFLKAPPGHPCNYQEKVLAVKPDLIVSEFVNDCSLNTQVVEEAYKRILKDFQAIGAEWIILTPHYTTFNVFSERNVDEDPRLYVKMVRRFALENGIALADASLRYEHLCREGIPWSSLMVNTANHPVIRGMAIFADSLMLLFPANTK